MYKKPKTIYQDARMRTNYTQEMAAERLPCSLESLRDYERGVTVPSSEIVIAMSNLYQAPWLLHQHLFNHDAIARIILPEIKLLPLASSVLYLQRELGHINAVMPDMIEISYDNEITPSEKAMMQRSKEEITHTLGAAFAVSLALNLSLYAQAKEKPSEGQLRRC